ncbi:MAG TPA: malto-oligosyltrehalose synthase [Actinomycetes bacterium]|nr:malto-oligosyltrehalose synthase [Actinomycetes bacterium]
MSTVQSTYRVQLSARFPFAAVRAVLPYLADLGVSHLYVSPVLRARSGSAHGYDVVDPTEVSPELGGEGGLRELVAALRGHGMGLVVDLVPNHMAASEENPWWVDVLRHGQGSRFARVFDVDWAAAGGRVRLPVLGAPLEQVRGELRVEDGWVRYHQQRFPLAPGTDRLDRQHYELVEWRRAAVDGNYRRFFTINDLVGVRQEDPEVFRLTHATILRLVAEGLVDGVRVDHVDGLADPAGYLRRLADGGVPWVVVEKVLEGRERLPPWPVAGTTGYEFLALADGLLLDPAAAGPFTERYAALSGRDPNGAALAVACKREQLRRAFGAEVAAVARHLPGDQAANRDAVVELAAQLPVYRTYVTDRVGDADQAVLTSAGGAVADRLWDGGEVDPGALDRLLGALLLASPEGSGEPQGGAPEGRAPEAVRRFQQLSGPAMAKGVEDEAVYRDVRLLARSEVGGDLAGFGRSPAEFHAAAAERERRWPRSMLATSTHDTKRGEDVRARLAALTDDPDRWWALAERWTARLAAGVDPADALALWQTMVGAWPLPRERCLAYLRKAVREAGLRSSWTDPDQGYEAAVADLVARAYGDAGLLAELEALVEVVAPAGRVRAAGLALLRLTAPGVPDTYQGTETEQLVLVDPDNRRPVAFRGDGSLKFRVTRTALRLRRRRPELFTGYRPLAAPEHLLAYLRGGDRLAAVVTCLPRPPGAATVELPAGPWRELLAGGTFPGGPTPVARLLAATPHALLVREEP